MTDTSESTGRIAAALQHLRVERGTTFDELVIVDAGDGLKMALRSVKAFCLGERGCYGRNLDALLERLGSDHKRLYELATVAVQGDKGWVVECCCGCSALLPASGRHEAGWRFATCSDSEPRWRCSDCDGP